MIEFFLSNDRQAGKGAGRLLDVATEDCTDLLFAVSERLRSTVDDDFVFPFLGYLHKQSQPASTSILECAAALDQIGKTLVYEIQKQHDLALEVLRLKAQLKQFTAETHHSRISSGMHSHDLAATVARSHVRLSDLTP